MNAWFYMMLVKGINVTCELDLGPPFGKRCDSAASVGRPTPVAAQGPKLLSCRYS
jgi:hypothetical protein